MGSGISLSLGWGRFSALNVIRDVIDLVDNRGHRPDFLMDLAENREVAQVRLFVGLGAGEGADRPFALCLGGRFRFLHRVFAAANHVGQSGHVRSA